MYKSVKAIALGTVATSLGILHFDPDRKDEGGRYQGMILPEPDAEKARKRELVEITGDATAEDFKRQQLGLGVDTSKVREIAADAIALASQEADENSSGLMAGDAAVSTASIRNFPEGAGPDAVPSGGNSDEAPLPGGGAAASEGGASADQNQKTELPAALRQQNALVLKHIEGSTDAAEIDTLLAAEKGRGDKARDPIVKALEARAAKLAK